MFWTFAAAAPGPGVAAVMVAWSLELSTKVRGSFHKQRQEKASNLIICQETALNRCLNIVCSSAIGMLFRKVFH